MVYFKIKRTTALKKLFEAYRQRQCLLLDQVRFLFDGQELNDSQTPDDLDMEEDDIIDCLKAPVVEEPPAARVQEDSLTAEEHAELTALEAAEMEKMAVLVSMGFENRDENIALLQKHGFDLEKALEELLN
ncbi:hypothetical protein T484DRAFT_3204408 [Baffinella frigidus]|nr:hypothetical protein T484DRAFT_3204408 [Cryptophyta sp. CCMP2293]